MMLNQHSVKILLAVEHSFKICSADRLQLQADWMILENNEKATLNIKMHDCFQHPIWYNWPSLYIKSIHQH